MGRVKTLSYLESFSNKETYLFDRYTGGLAQHAAGRRENKAMSGLLERGFGMLEYLVAHPDGSSLSALSGDLDLPLSATHRLLTELIRLGYVRQEPTHGTYGLTIKMVAMGLSYLSSTGITDVAQPLLDRLAAESGELVRLAVIDGDLLTFVAKAQGARTGLRYDPDMGLSVPLSCSAAGHAWLSTMSDEEALQRVARQGFGKPEDFGPKAPLTVKALLAYLKLARSRGFSVIVEVFAPAMSAMSAPVRNRQGQAIGVVTIAGPVIRLTEERLLGLGPALMQTASEIGQASSASELFKRRAA